MRQQVNPSIRNNASYVKCIQLTMEFKLFADQSERYIKEWIRNERATFEFMKEHVNDFIAELTRKSNRIVELLRKSGKSGPLPPSSLSSEPCVCPPAAKRKKFRDEELEKMDVMSSASSSSTDTGL